MTWPTDDLLTSALDEDSDLVAGAGQGRDQIYQAVLKLKEIIGAVTEGATIWHSANDSTLVKTDQVNVLDEDLIVEASRDSRSYVIVRSHPGRDNEPNGFQIQKSDGTIVGGIYSTPEEDENGNAIFISLSSNIRAGRRIEMAGNCQNLTLSENDIKYGSSSLLPSGAQLFGMMSITPPSPSLSAAGTSEKTTTEIVSSNGLVSMDIEKPKESSIQPMEANIRTSDESPTFRVRMKLQTPYPHCNYFVTAQAIPHEGSIVHGYSIEENAQDTLVEFPVSELEIDRVKIMIQAFD